MINRGITLQDIIDKCKCSVTLTVNDHKDQYETVEQYMNFRYDTLGHTEMGDLHGDLVQEMINKDTIIQIQAYPRTPIGFYRVYHHDMQQAIANMYGLLQGE